MVAMPSRPAAFPVRAGPEGSFGNTVPQEVADIMKPGIDRPQEPDAHAPPAMRTVADTASIHDNARRSVSIRINTSDYGRIKVAARRLRAKEADVFRYLLQVGLSRLGPLLGEGPGDHGCIHALAELGPDLAANFGIDAGEFARLLGAYTGSPAPAFDAADLELVALAGTHPHLVQGRLSEFFGRPVAGCELRRGLRGYLMTKYQGQGTPS